MKELLAAVREGRSRDVPGLLKPLSPAERKACLIELKALRAELRGWGWDRWQERFKVSRALLPAGAGCHTGAAATAAWIGARDLRDGGRPLHGLLIDLLADRAPEWLGDLAHRLAGRSSTAEEDYQLIHELVRLAKCEMPTTDGVVYGWAEAACSGRGKGLGRLGEDPHVRTLVPRLFETPRLAGPLTWFDDPQAPNHWPTALAGLATEGVLDRSVLVDACVARLLRGGRPGEMRFFLILLRRLELTPAEESARVPDWTGMAADGMSTVAAHAQGVLARLAGGGELPAAALADVSSAVLFRTEKKLVRAQLVLLGKALRRDAGSAGELLPVVADAFGHQDVGVQEQALKLVGRHLSAADDDLRKELAAAAALLSPAHRAATVEIFGALPDDGVPGEYEEILPLAPEPRRLAPAADSVAELVEDVVVQLRADDDVSGFERTLDGLVRLAHQEPAALADALRPALADRWWLDDTYRGDRDQHFSAHPYGMEVVIAALLERVSVKALNSARVRGITTDGCAHAGLDGIFNARLWEAAFRVRTRSLPFLLATPTWHTGALEADELVDRLREYRRLDVRPGPVDFAQALLRVPRGVGGTAAHSAAQLGTREGDRLAAWLTGDGPVVPALQTGAGAEFPEAAAPGRWQPGSSTRRKLHETKERLTIQREFPRWFHWLGRVQSLSHARCYHWGAGRPHWMAALPHEREAHAGWMLPGLTACALDDLPGATWGLPLLAEAAGANSPEPAEPAGPALHRALATGLGARSQEDRLAAVDALLVLAARGRLDGSRLGRDLAELVGQGTVKPNRLAGSARTAAATGAYATTWSVLSGALPGLLSADQPPRGLWEILAVAAECVETCGTAAEVSGSPGGIPGLADLAGRRGSSQLIAQASRLLTALDHRAEHSTPETAKNRR